MSIKSDLKFNTSIHGARGLFCVFVVLYHIWNSGLPRWPVPEILNQIFGSFRYGVELFFAISGFVIHVTMQPVLNGSATPLQFILNRTTRIFPVLWVTVALFLPLGILKGESQITGYLEPFWLFVVTLAGNLLALGPIWPVPVFYGVTWSIGYEFVFYSLCFGHLLIHYYFNKNMSWLLIFVGILVVLAHPRAVFFLSGLIVGHLREYNQLKQTAKNFPLLWLVLFLFSWHWLAAEKSPFFINMFFWNFSFQWPLGILAFVAMTKCIFGIADGKGNFCRFLNLSILQWLGTISYSLYLWHLIILGILKFALLKFGVVAVSGGWSQFILALFGFPSSVAIAHVSHIVLEQKFTQWLRKTLRFQFTRPASEIR